MPSSSASMVIEFENSRQQIEQLCIAFLQTDMDLAFSYLRLAVGECRLENRARAVSLIERVILAYRTVSKQIDHLPVEFAEERCQLRERAGELFAAIVRAESQLHIVSG